MVAQRAADQHHVARPALRAPQIHALGQRADAARVDVHAIAMAAIHHLGVAGHQPHARLAGAFRHGRADTFEVFDGKAFFQDEPDAQVARRRAAGGHVVHRAAHGQAPNVAAREEMGRHHEAVGGKRQTLAPAQAPAARRRRRPAAVRPLHRRRRTPRR